MGTTRVGPERIKANPAHRCDWPIITESQNLEFRAEVYNLFNRTNFATPPITLNQSLGTGKNQLQPGQPFTPAAAGGAFGVFNSTVEKAVGLGTSRQVQLSLRYNF